jgi:hypothetical protein
VYHRADATESAAAVSNTKENLVINPIEMERVPRDYAGCCELQLSQQFLIVYRLKKVDTEDQKIAFNALSKEGRARMVYEAILEYDNAQKGGSSMAPTQPNQGQLPMAGTFNMPPPQGQMGQPSMGSVPQQMGGAPQGMQPMGMQPSPLAQMGGMQPQMGAGMQQAPAPNPQQFNGMPQMPSMQQQPAGMMNMQQPAGFAPPGAAPPPQANAPQGMQPMGGQTPGAAPAAASAQQIQQLAQAVQALTSAVERLSGGVSDTQQRVQGIAKISSVQLLVLVAFIQSVRNGNYNELIAYYKGLVQTGADTDLLAQLQLISGK